MYKGLLQWIMDEADSLTLHGGVVQMESPKEGTRLVGYK